MHWGHEPEGISDLKFEISEEEQEKEEEDESRIKIQIKKMRITVHGEPSFAVAHVLGP